METGPGGDEKGSGGDGDRARRRWRQGQEELETGKGGAEDRARRRETETGGDGHRDLRRWK